MVAVPRQRPSPDLWTVTLSHVSTVDDTVTAARSCGWYVVSATRVGQQVRLVLRR